MGSGTVSLLGSIWLKPTPNDPIRRNAIPNKINEFVCRKLPVFKQTRYSHPHIFNFFVKIKHPPKKRNQDY